MKYLKLLIFFAFFIFLSFASALVIKQFTLKEMVLKSKAIIRGTPVSKVSKWDKNHHRIFTFWTIKVREVIKGKDVPDTIILRQLGGTVGDISMSISGDAKLEIGEDVLLFLRGDSKYYYIVALSQGKFTIQKINGKEYLFRNRVDLREIDTKRISAPLYEEYKNEIKAIVNGN